MVEAIDYLKQYRALINKAARMIDVYNQLDADVGLKSRSADGMPRGSGKSDPTANYAIRLAEARRNALNASVEYKEAAMDILNTINSAELTEYEYDIIFARYVAMPKAYGARIPSWADIAHDLNFSMGHAKRIHGEALKKIESRISNDTKRDFA